MNPVSSRFLRAGLTAVALAASWVLPLHADDTDITAVYSATANGYQRERGPDGRFKPETYAFGEGRHEETALVDMSMDKLGFMDIARQIAVPLRRQNYIPSTNANETKLLILVFWGTTAGAEGGRFAQGLEGISSAMRSLNAAGGATPPGQAMAYNMGSAQGMAQQAASDEFTQAMIMNQALNTMRDRNNGRNAAILGYWEELEKAERLPTFSFSKSIIEEIEADRYFVVLKAYDFQRLWKEKTKYLLWETRFSIRRHNNRFDVVLPAMTMTASKYFGQNSGRLMREEVPVGRVEVGDPVVVEAGKTE